MPDPEVANSNDVLNKLSQALIQVSRGDPLVALRNELHIRFQAIDTRFAAIDKATELQHEDMVRVPTQVDKAVDGLRGVLEQLIATKMAEIVGRLEALKAESNQKFEGVKLQFAERDVRTDHDSESNRTMVEQASVASKTAIDAAFLANQKAADANAEYVDKSITKSETATKEKIDGLSASLEKQFSSVQEKIGALTSRFDRGEGASRGPNDTERMLSEFAHRLDTVIGSAKGSSDTRSERRSDLASSAGIAGLVVSIVVAVMLAVTFVSSHQSPPPTVVSPAVIPMQTK